MVVDVPLLIANLGQDSSLASDVVRRMVHLIATVSPGAKLGSTAPYSYADMMLIEASDSQPRSLANAFLKPVPAIDPLPYAYDALAEYLSERDKCFGRTIRDAIALGAGGRLAPILTVDERAHSLEELAKWTAAQIAAE